VTAPIARRTHTLFARLRRSVRFHLLIPIFRSPHPPEYTARGIALGVFWGVTPFLGAQTLLMIATWQLMKRTFGKDASLVQALAWAWINNPLTMIPMYYAFYLTGLWLVGSPAPSGGYDAFASLWEASRNQPTLLARVERLAGHVGVAVLVGCVPYALLGSWAAYQWALRIVRARQRRVEHRARVPAGYARVNSHGSTSPLEFPRGNPE
jgi:uncharacterized protein